MKKLISVLVLFAALLGSAWAKGKIASLDRGFVYIVYKIEVRNDINRDFYAKTLGYPELAGEPHMTGTYGKTLKGKPHYNELMSMVKTSDQEIAYYQGREAGLVSVAQLHASKGEGKLEGLSMHLFGSRFTVALPVSDSYNEENVFANGNPFNVISFDPSAKYVYLGTFVYDFIDGTIYPSLVEVIDEYDEALAWLEDETGKKVQMSRCTIE